MSLIEKNNILKLSKVFKEIVNFSSILIEDSVIEEYLSKEIEKDDIKNIAIFGFKDRLRLIAEIESLINLEVIIEIYFENLVWNKDKHELTFRYSVLEVYPSNITTKALKIAPGILSNILIPFSGFISNQIIDILFKKFSGESVINKINFDAVKLEKNIIKVSLDDLLDNNSILKYLNDFISIKELKFDKKGLNIKISLTEEASKLKNLFY